ncbi:hypothetical protein GQR58_017864 [Nymphon striatum]|nr:hypothetical protein GQR58_017864 [Nymphon striatum]
MPEWLVGEEGGLWCIKWYESRPFKVRTEARVLFMMDHHDKQLRPSFIVCKSHQSGISPDIRSPYEVSVVIVKTHRFDALDLTLDQICLQVTVLESRKRSGDPNPIPVRKISEIVDWNEFRNTMAVCIKPLFGPYSDTLALAEFIAYYRLKGVTKFILFRSGLSVDTWLFLSMLKLKKIVDIDILPWNLWKRGNEVHDNAGAVSINDCIYRYMNRYESILVADIDEFVAPKDVSLTLPEIVSHHEKHTQHPVYSFMILNKFFCQEYGVALNATKHLQNLKLKTQLCNDIGKDLLMGTVYGNRGRGRLKTRFSDNSKEIGNGRSFVALYRMAQDRVSWRATAVQFEPTIYSLTLTSLAIIYTGYTKWYKVDNAATTNSTREDEEVPIDVKTTSTAATTHYEEDNFVELADHDDWIHTGNEVYLYSAHWDNRSDIAMGTSVRVMGIVPVSIIEINVGITCLLWYKNKTKAIKITADIEFLQEHHEKPSRAVFIICPSPNEQFQPPYAVSLQLASQEKRLAVGLPNPLPVRMILNHSGNITDKIAVCVKPVRKIISSTLTVAEFIAFYRAVGVTKFVFFSTGLTAEVWLFLRKLANKIGTRSGSTSMESVQAVGGCS